MNIHDAFTSTKKAFALGLTLRQKNAKEIKQARTKISAFNAIGLMDFALYRRNIGTAGGFAQRFSRNQKNIAQQKEIIRDLRKSPPTRGNDQRSTAKSYQLN